MDRTEFLKALVAGSFAGVAVDVSLFPLDTLKTRLQSAEGLWASGGFRGIYSGLASAALGSAPTAALFFCTYEATKTVLEKQLVSSDNVHLLPLCHMTGASLGEVAACLVRVPVEVVKQRTQVLKNSSSLSNFRRTVAQEGFAGLYRGFTTTVLREIPFSFLQMPMWEYFKAFWSTRQGHAVQPWQSSVCGAIAGGLAAGITTPFDVAKTRVMLAPMGSEVSRGGMLYAMRDVAKQSGMLGLFSGIVPRTLWTSIGGAIFLGVYDKVRHILHNSTFL